MYIVCSCNFSCFIINSLIGTNISFAEAFFCLFPELVPGGAALSGGGEPIEASGMNNNPKRAEKVSPKILVLVV